MDLQGVMQEHRRRSLPFRYVRARPRLFASFVLGLVAGLLLPHHWAIATRLLIAWNVGAIAFLASVFVMMVRSSHQTIRRHAVLHDEGKNLILTLASVAATASIAAIVFQLGNMQGVTGVLRAFHLLLAGLTIVSSWSFVHVMFTLHYAHEYFRDDLPLSGRSAGGPPGLDIPGDDTAPDYFDFMYFAFVIGVASATADINIASRRIRRVALVHGILSFFFNIAVLGLSINIAAGMI